VVVHTDEDNVKTGFNLFLNILNVAWILKLFLVLVNIPELKKIPKILLYDVECYIFILIYFELCYLFYLMVKYIFFSFL